MSATTRWTETELRAAVSSSSTLAEVLRKLGLFEQSGSARPHIKKYIARFGINTNHFSYTPMRKWTDDALVQAVAESHSMSVVVARLGIRGGGNFASIYKHIKRLSLSTDHFLPQQRDRKMVELASQLVVGSPRENTHHLKKRLIQAELLPNQCAECLIVTWQGKPLSLHLDHINGDRSDNRIGNLRLLCPNCHSQTPTYAGKKKKNKRK